MSAIRIKGGDLFVIVDLIQQPFNLFAICGLCAKSYLLARMSHDFADAVAKHEQRLHDKAGHGERHQNFYADELALSDDSAPGTHSHLFSDLNSGSNVKNAKPETGSSKPGKPDNDQEKKTEDSGLAKERKSAGGDGKGSKEDKAGHVGPAPLAALFQVGQMLPTQQALGRL